MNPALAAVAAANGGIFTYDEACASGYSRSQIARRLDSGRWIRLRRGTYAHSDSRIATPEVVLAWQRRIRGGAAGHETAAAVHGISLFRDYPRTTLVRPGRRRGIEQYDGLRLTSAPLPADHLQEVGGILVTSPARTVVDIARNRGFASGVVAADSVLRLGLTTREELSKVVADCRRWPGLAAARKASNFADARSESVLESLGRVRFHERSLPAPDLQVWLAPDIRVDFYWQSSRVVGEADGLAKYTEADVLREEKLRQERLEQLGVKVVRFTYGDATRGVPAMVERFRRALG